jgi:hypothetical protein
MVSSSLEISKFLIEKSMPFIFNGKYIVADKYGMKNAFLIDQENLQRRSNPHPIPQPTTRDKGLKNCLLHQARKHVSIRTNGKRA